jgi:hypothetical protein
MTPEAARRLPYAELVRLLHPSRRIGELRRLPTLSAAQASELAGHVETAHFVFREWQRRADAGDIA